MTHTWTHNNVGNVVKEEKKNLKLNLARHNQPLWYIYRQVCNTIKKHFVFKWGKYGFGDIGWHGREGNDWLYLDRTLVANSITVEKWQKLLNNKSLATYTCSNRDALPVGFFFLLQDCQNKLLQLTWALGRKRGVLSLSKHNSVIYRWKRKKGHSHNFYFP